MKKISYNKVVCILLMATLWSSRSFARLTVGNVDENNPTQKPVSNVSKLLQNKGSQLSQAQVEYLHALVVYLNSRTGKHFGVVTHAEDNSLDLSCFDCDVDELDAAKIILVGLNAENPA